MEVATKIHFANLKFSVAEGNFMNSVKAINAYPFTRAKRSVVFCKLVTFRSIISFRSNTPDYANTVSENACT
jgi:hypothetical protein